MDSKEMQRRSAAARWAKFTPEQRSEAMRKIAQKPRKSRKKKSVDGK
jgi:predicted Fe-S protein YdhL (DUF1289 family)